MTAEEARSALSSDRCRGPLASGGARPLRSARLFASAKTACGEDGDDPCDDAAAAAAAAATAAAAVECLSPASSMGELSSTGGDELVLLTDSAGEDVELGTTTLPTADVSGMDGGWEPLL